MGTTILIVDDDKGHRRSLREALEDRGYIITDVDSIKLLTELEKGLLQIDDFDLALVDAVTYTAAGKFLTGPEIATRLKEFRPGTKVIAMSADEHLLSFGDRGWGKTQPLGRLCDFIEVLKQEI